jgi:hypothetical protein
MGCQSRKVALQMSATNTYTIIGTIGQIGALSRTISCDGPEVTIRVDLNAWTNILRETTPFMWPTKLGNVLWEDGVDKDGCGVRRMRLYGVTIETPLRKYAERRGGYRWDL